MITFDNEKYYTTQEVADMFHLNVASVRAMIREKRLKATKFGKFYQISETEIKEYMKRNEN